MRFPKKYLYGWTAAAVFCLFVRVPAAYSGSLQDLLGGKKYQELLEQKEKELQAVTAQKDQEYKDLLEKKQELQKLTEDLQKKLDDLAKTSGNMEADRANMMAQLKRLLQEKTEMTDAQSALEGVNKEKADLLEKKKQLEEQNGVYAQGIEKLKSHLKELMAERAQISAQLTEAQKGEEAIVRRVQRETAAELESLRKKTAALGKENTGLRAAQDKAQKEARLLEKAKSELGQRVEVLENQLSELEESYEKMKKESRLLAEQSQEFPKRFTDLARQNKRLIEQTADMHYNQGVFYAKNKEFKRAVKEFEQVLDLKPKDPQANYNLGYIYAEHLVDRPKAIQYFKDYLTYAPDAQDADWVRRYITTWQTWYGREPMK